MLRQYLTRLFRGNLPIPAKATRPPHNPRCGLIRCPARSSESESPFPARQAGRTRKTTDLAERVAFSTILVGPSNTGYLGRR